MRGLPEIIKMNEEAAHKENTEMNELDETLAYAINSFRDDPCVDTYDSLLYTIAEYQKYGCGLSLNFLHSIVEPMMRGEHD